MTNFNEYANFIWQIAELLRGPYRPNEYKYVMLPLTVLRRLDCVLEPTKDEVLAKYEELERSSFEKYDKMLVPITGVPFYNTSRFTFERLKDDPENIAANLIHYIKSYSTTAREIFDRFGFEKQIAKLEQHDRLYQVISRFAEMDFHPDTVPNIQMGYIFEELIRRFNEISNEEAGDHFTPREVIRLMVDLLFTPDDDTLSTPHIIKTLYDPACGTGGMLSVAETYLSEFNEHSNLIAFGQDYNDQAYAICASDMLIKGNDIEFIAFGDSFTDDRFPERKFDYMLANPPFGVEWKPQEDFIKREHEEEVFGGRFGPGLPRISDGSLLFLLHMISKMKPVAEGGTRLAIVFNGSPLFTGGAGSGESEIRRWIIEKDWLETIVALPDQLFYNTGIYTCFWIVTNRKAPERQGTIQLIDATSFYKKMRKSLGNKRNEICEEQRKEITRLYGSFTEGEHVRIFDNSEFGYQRIRVERPLQLSFRIDEERLERLRETRTFQNLAKSKKRKPEARRLEIAAGERLQQSILEVLHSLEDGALYKSRDEFDAVLKQAFKKSNVSVTTQLRKAILKALGERDETAEVCTDKKGNPEPDPNLRDYENVPLTEDIHDYMAREVLPHVPDAWVDESQTRIGYEINFNRYFYTYTPPRPLAEIEADIKKIERDIIQLLGELTNE